MLYVKESVRGLAGAQQLIFAQVPPQQLSLAMVGLKKALKNTSIITFLEIGSSLL